MKKIISMLMASVMAVSLVGLLPTSATSAPVDIGDVGIPVNGYVCTYYESKGDGRIKYTYDSKGNLIYQEDDKGNSEFHKYTYYKNGKLKSEYIEQNDGYWEKYTYDKNGNRTSYSTSKGFWEKFKYNKYGDCILCKDSKGFSYTKEFTYFPNGKIKTQYYKNSDNEWWKSIYDENGNEIYTDGYSFEGFEEGWEKYKYDSYGNMIYEEHEGGYIATYEYTYYDNGKVKTESQKTNDGYKSTSYYDEKGNLTYKTELDVFWEKYTYDKNGNQIYYEDSQGEWEKYTYDENGNVIKAKGDHKYWAKAKYAKAGSKKTIKPISSIRSAKAVAKDKKAAEKAVKKSEIKNLSVKSKSKNIKVSWKKAKKAWGYKVQVSKDKDFKKVVFNKNLKDTSLDINNKKIKSKKTYYVKVKAYASYRNKNGKAIKVYSKLSSIKKIRVK